MAIGDVSVSIDQCKEGTLHKEASTEVLLAGPPLLDEKFVGAVIDSLFIVMWTRIQNMLLFTKHV